MTFQFNHAKVNVTITALKGKTMSLPLPSIHLTDIGKESEGFSPVEFAQTILSSITKAVVGVASSAVDLTGGALKSLSHGAADAAGGVVKKGFGLFGRD